MLRPAVTAAAPRRRCCTPLPAAAAAAAAYTTAAWIFKDTVPHMGGYLNGEGMEFRLY